MRHLRLSPLLLVGVSALLEGCKGCGEDPNTNPPAPPEDPHDVGQWLSMEVMGDQPAITYYDRTSGGLAFALGTIDGDKVKWKEERVDGFPGSDGLDAGDRGKYSSLLVKGEEAWIAYYDVTNKNLFYARRSASGDWETGLADSGGGPTPDAGLWASIAEGADGNPFVAHYDAGKQQLRVARWSGSAFTGAMVDEGSDSAPDSAGETKDADVGKYARAFSDGSKDYVAYYDAANGDLKLATYSGGSWSVEVVDAEGDVGAWPAIAADGGDVLIAYQDVGNQDLKLARGKPGAFTTEVVDAGEFAGADAEIFMNGSYPGILYFDGLNNDVRQATFDGSAWSLATVDGTDAGLGFHNETVTVGGSRYAACYDYTNRSIWFKKL